jgi:hypothetical protein
MNKWIMNMQELTEFLVIIKNVLLLLLEKIVKFSNLKELLLVNLFLELDL